MLRRPPELLVKDETRPASDSSGRRPLMDQRDGTNRDLLVGLLALQNGLVEQDVLILAFRTWTRDKSRPISDLLVAHGAIDEDERSLLEGLAAKHLRRHGGDSEQSLAALNPAPEAYRQLAAIDD